MNTLTPRLTRLASLVLATLVGSSILSPHAWADAKIYRNTLRSTAWVLSKDSTGSGVLVDAENRLLVTNEHVVDDQPAVTVFFAEFENGQPVTDSKHYVNNKAKLGIAARVIAADAKRDVAILQLARLPEGVTAIEMAANSPSPGEQIHSIGNPGFSGALWVYTAGKVRAVYRKQFSTGKQHDMRVVETDSPINPGDSGGPVVNDEGKLIAISQGAYMKARLMSYSVDISEIRALVADDLTNANLRLGKLIAGTGLRVVADTALAFAVDFSTAGTSQRVFVAKKAENYGTTATRRVFSVAHVATDKLSLEITLKLLSQNARTKLGSWAIEQKPGGQTLIVFTATADGTASPQRLQTVVEYVAKIAASMQAELAKK